MPAPGGIRLASSAAGTTICGMTANGPSPGCRTPSPGDGAGTAIRPGQPTSRPAEVKAGTNSAPRQVTVGSVTADPSVAGWRRAAEAGAALG
jgi:hypothetical protein